MCIKHAKSARSDTGKCGSGDELVSALFSVMPIYKIGTALKLQEQRLASRGKCLKNGGVGLK